MVLAFRFQNMTFVDDAIPHQPVHAEAIPADTRKEVYRLPVITVRLAENRQRFIVSGTAPSRGGSSAAEYIPNVQHDRADTNMKPTGGDRYG